MVSLKMKPLIAALIILTFSASLLGALTLPPSPAFDGRNSLPIMSPPVAQFTTPPPNTYASCDGIRENVSDAIVTPDPQIAVGPNNIVEMANRMVEIFSKQGTSVKNYTFSSFFNVGPGAADPAVIYDASSGRFFAVVEPSGVLAVSTSNDPTGTWNKYNFGSCAGHVPSIGVSDDKLVISASTSDSSPQGVRHICVANKSELTAGSSIIHTANFTDTSNGAHPVQSLSPTTTEFMVSTGTGTAPRNTTKVFAITGTPPGNVTMQLTNVSTAATTQIDPLYDGYDFRVQDAAWFKGALWYAFNDGCTPPNDPLIRGCIRLTEISTNSTTCYTNPPFCVNLDYPVLQDFDVGVAGQYIYLPALRIDGNGNLDVVYDGTNALAVTGRKISDPLNTVRQPLVIKNIGGLVPGGSGSVFGGDYYGASLDPSDPGLVWVAGEYVLPSGGSCPNSLPPPKTVSCWRTFVASMSLIQSFSMNMNPANLQVTAPSPGGFATRYANLTITSFGFNGQITLSNNPNFTTALAGPLLGYSQTVVNLSPGQTITVTVSAGICSTTPSRTFTITGNSSIFTNNVTFTVTVTGQRRGACPT